MAHRPNMVSYVSIMAVVVVVVTVSGSSLTTSLTLLEQHAMAKILREPPKDLPSIYYSTLALTAMDKEVREPHIVCNYAHRYLDKTNPESLMQFSTVIRALQCKDAPDVGLDVSLLITEDIGAVDLAHLVAAMANLGGTVDDELIKRFVNVAKDNDSPKVAAALFATAALLPKENEDVKVVVSMVEDVVAQADEVNKSQLQFEGGLSVTSEVVSSILALGDIRGEKLLKDEQAVKFATYFLNRKYVRSVKDVHHLIVALGGLSKNLHVVPVVVSVFQSPLITSESPLLKLRVTNLIDQSIPDVSLKVDKLVGDKDETVLLEDVVLQKSDETDDYIVINSEVAKGFVAANAFKLDVMAVTHNRGSYNCTVGVTLKEGAGEQFLLDGSFTIRTKVLSKIMVEDVVIGVADRDQSSLSKTTNLKFPSKVPKVLDADYHQKLVMTFVLRDIEHEDLVTVHQSFVRLVHEGTGQEIFFVAEADSDMKYKFTLDVGTTGKDSFNNLSGRYRLTLIVGDSAMQVPIAWTLGDISLTFKSDTQKTKRQQRITEPQPAIEHMFRVPEKRPSKLVSTAFTGLIMGSVLIMFGMWMKIGVNVNNFRFTLPTVFFHLGLAGVFILYYMFWVHLDMFVTLKLLMVIGGVTFLSGNRMLADMASARGK